MTPALYNFLSILFLIIVVLLILVILVQRGRGGGLVGAFGGPGGASAFGAKTGDVFTVITVIMAVLFLVLGCLLAFRPPPTPLGGLTDNAAPPITIGAGQQPVELPVDVPGEPERQEKTSDE